MNRSVSPIEVSIFAVCLLVEVGDNAVLFVEWWDYQRGTRRGLVGEATPS